MKRRTFVQLSGLSALPLLQQRFSWAMQPSGDAAGSNVLVCLFLRGGIDGLNVLPPFTESRYYDLRPTIAVAEPGSGDDTAIDLDGFYGMHPSLASLQPYFDDGSLAWVHATGLDHDTHSHFDAQDLMERGITELDIAFDGWLNRHLALQTVNGATFRAIGMGSAVQRSLSGPVPVIGISSIESFGLLAPGPAGPALEHALAGMYQAATPLDHEAQSALGAMQELATIDPAQFPVENDAEYPDTDFGSRFSELARLIKADIGLETACIDIGGWDHHDRENQALPGLLSELALTLDAFATDMGERMQRVTVVAMSEFGRRVFENASGGTDHGHGNVMLLLGAGINGGKVYGQWPGLGPDELVFSGDLASTTDYRTVLAEILQQRFGQTQIDAVFPDYTEQAPLGLIAA